MWIYIIIEVNLLDVAVTGALRSLIWVRSTFFNRLIPADGSHISFRTSERLGLPPLLAELILSAGGGGGGAPPPLNRGGGGGGGPLPNDGGGGGGGGGGPGIYFFRQ